MMKLVRPDSYLHFGWMDLPEFTHVSIAAAPVSLRGKTALFISDVHLREGVSDTKLAALAALLKAQEADMILLGGDYAETADQCVRFFEALSVVPAPMGCFGVMGNNDSECFPDADVLRKLMHRCGARLLINETVAPVNGVQIGGCGDHKHGHPRTQGLFDADSYRILLSHFPIRPDCTAELMLSGHTHGGQFNILGVTPYIVGFEHGYGIGAISGMNSLGDVPVLVSKGIGVSKLPLRIGVRPQVHLVKFTG